MKEYKANKFWLGSLVMALLLVAFLSGCGREQVEGTLPPTVVAVTPLNGATNVLLGTTVTATFSSVMAPATINTATFTVTGPGTTAVAGTVTLAGTTATFTPTNPLVANTLFVGTITTGATDPTGSALAANFVWSFRTGAPAVISTVPANGATAVAVNTTVTATFSTAMNPTTINAATFTLAGPGAAPVAGAVTYAGTTATFTPTAVLAANTLYTATITTGAKDPLGNALAANYVWTFTTNVAPTVVSTVPAGGATAVAVNTIVSATFSRAMNPATISNATFTLTGPGVTPVGGVVTYSGTTATFTPTALLAANTLYTATITTGAKDPTGEPLAANVAWNFTTNVAPTVTSTVPLNGATGVAANTTVTATFSRAMNPATITAASFTLTGPGLTPVAGAVTYTGTTATFTPSAALTLNTLYTATITTGATDTTGEPLAANFVWTFTAGPPTVISTVPANGAIGVAINATVDATFNRAMNPATLTTATFTLTGPGLTPVTGAVTYTGTTATFTPTALLIANTLYTATITTGAQGPAGDALAANYVWTFTTNVPPTVVSTVPANGASGVAANAVVTATFSRAMNANTITPATFTVTGPGATAVAGGVALVGTTATFTPGAPLAVNVLYTATITTGATDTTGSALASNYVWTFSTTPLPMVTSTNPANAATNVAINQKITATFNRAMTPATITAAGTFSLAVTTGGAAVPGVVTYDAASNSAIFTPTANLAASTQFTATITTAAQSSTGNGLPSNYVWTFTTGTVASATAPTVASTNPASGATLVPLNQKIAATFSKAMDPATISAAGTVTVVVTIGGATVPGVVTYDTASRTVLFTPTANLTASTEYTATISAAAKDLSGNVLIAGAVPNPWSFTTGTTANVTAPTITLTNPASAATGVAINQTINATFSAPMDPTTINNASFTLEVAGAGGAQITGTVAYDVPSRIATFTPSANLAAGTQYTATIANTVKDETGIALVAGLVPNPWNFTTGAALGTGPAPVNLGAAATFGAIGGGAGITNQGILTVVNGDIGTTGVSTAVTGFNDAGPGCIYTETTLNIGQVNGNIYTAPPPPTVNCPTEGTATTFSIATQALAAANTAYINLSPAVLPGGTDPGAGQLGGLVLAPGVYKAAGGTFMITGSDLTLDAMGNSNAVWVFQSATSLTVGAPGAPRNVILVNGAQAKNVFWQVGSAATINAAGGGTMVGTIIASAGLTFSTAGNVALTTLNGRALGLNASVTMVNATINVPPQ